MRNAPVPKDLNADEKQIYRDELEKVVVVIEDKAHRRLQVRLRGAAARRLQRAHPEAPRRRSGGMSDQEFPPEAEARARPTPAEPRPVCPLSGPCIDEAGA